jgi:hypothetical protein
VWVDLPVAIRNRTEDAVKLAAVVVEQEDGHPGKTRHKMLIEALDAIQSGNLWKGRCYEPWQAYRQYLAARTLSLCIVHSTSEDVAAQKQVQ